MIVVYTAEEWAAREATVLAARAKIEKMNMYPSRRAVAVVTEWKVTSVARVIRRLKARSAWPPSAVPNTPPHWLEPGALRLREVAEAGGRLTTRQLAARIARANAARADRLAAGLDVTLSPAEWTAVLEATGDYEAAGAVTPASAPARRHPNAGGRPRPWDRERVRTPGTERAPRVYRTPMGFRGIGDSE